MFRKRRGEDPELIQSSLFGSGSRLGSFGGSIAQSISPKWVDLPPFDVLDFKTWYIIECDDPVCEDDCEVEDYDDIWGTYDVG